MIDTFQKPGVIIYSGCATTENRLSLCYVRIGKMMNKKKIKNILTTQMLVNLENFRQQQNDQKQQLKQ